MKLQVDKTRKILVSKLNILKNPFSPTQTTAFVAHRCYRGLNGAEYVYEYEVRLKPHVYLVIKHKFT